MYTIENCSTAINRHEALRSEANCSLYSIIISTYKRKDTNLALEKNNTKHQNDLPMMKQ